MERGFPDSSGGKEFSCNAGDLTLIPGLGRSPGEGIGYPLQYSWASSILCGSSGKESACNVGDLGSIHGLGRFPGEGKGYSLQYSSLENSRDFIVRGVTKSQTQLSDFHFHFHLEREYNAVNEAQALELGRACFSFHSRSSLATCEIK